MILKCYQVQCFELFDKQLNKFKTHFLLKKTIEKSFKKLSQVIDYNSYNTRTNEMERDEMLK